MMGDVIVVEGASSSRSSAESGTADAKEMWIVDHTEGWLSGVSADGI